MSTSVYNLVEWELNCWFVVCIHGDSLVEKGYIISYEYTEVVVN